MVPLLVAGGFLLLIGASMFMMHVLLPAIGAQLPQGNRTPAMRSGLGEYLFWAILVSWGSAARSSCMWRAHRAQAPRNCASAA